MNFCATNKLKERIRSNIKNIMNLERQNLGIEILIIFGIEILIIEILGIEILIINLHFQIIEIFLVHDTRFEEKENLSCIKFEEKPLQ